MAYSILIAEDDPSISELIQMTLVASGYSCKAVSDGQMAQEHIEVTEFHLALVDIMLPGMDGYQLLDLLRSKGIITAFYPFQPLPLSFIYSHCFTFIDTILEST